MSSQNTLRLERLSLTNFRCFDESEIVLDPELTVLVAENGQGKTGVLDAIAIAFGLFVKTLTAEPTSWGFKHSDVRQVLSDGHMVKSENVRFEASARIQNAQVRWSRELKRDASTARATTKDAKELIKCAAGLKAAALSPHSVGHTVTSLPLIAYYGTGRLWNDDLLYRGLRSKLVPPRGRLAGYFDALSHSSNYHTFVSWYGDTFLAAGSDPVSGERRDDRAEYLLASVESAVKTVLAPTGWHSLTWLDTRSHIVVSHPLKGTLPLSLLSDGVRNTIALVADIAHRCARLNPHLGIDAARDTPGILLIDEIDLHLHPSWQQQIILLLRTAFPMLQIIATSHSPQVLSTVDSAGVRLLKVDGNRMTIARPPYQTLGVESADVLAKTMGVDPIPPVIQAQWVREYRRLLQAGEYENEDARDLWARIVGHFRENHPIVDEISTIRRLQDFKRDNGIPIT